MGKATLIQCCLWSLLLAGVSLPAAAEELVAELPAPAGEASPGPAGSGVMLGSFRLLPEVTFSGTYDDNIFATRRETKADRVLHLLPALDLRSAWEKHRLDLKLGADIARYDHYQNEDFEDYWGTIDGRYDLSDTVNLFGGLGYSREHEERGSPDDQLGTEPTEYSSRSARLGTELKSGDLGFRFGGTYEELNYDDVTTSTGGTINNDARDRHLWGGGIRGSYAWSETLQLFAQYIYDERRYDNRLDDAGYRRDSDGYRLAAGVKFDFKPRLSAELYAGALRQEYDDPRFSTVSEPDFGVDLSFTPAPGTKLSAVIERSVEETTVRGVSGYLETRYRVNIDHLLTRTTTFRGHVQLAHDDYQGISREDDYLDAGFGVQYDLTRNLYLGADYNFLHRNSNSDSGRAPEDFDYYRHQFMVTLGARLYPVKDDPLKGFAGALAALQPAPEAPRGFYLGGLMSYGGILTTASEERLHGGSSQADFGHDGFAGGVFGGYSVNYGRWVVGVELEAQESDVEWDHAKAKAESRSFSVKQNEGFGGSARLGYTMLDGSVLYGRVGLVSTRFETSYRINELPLDDYTETESIDGWRFGVGVDVPLDEQWFWRMETTYTDYENYTVASSTFSERFEPEESLFSFGLGWRFDAPASRPAAAAGEEPGGFYAGAQVGFGTLNTEVSGVHRDGGSGAVAPYDSDFADQGYTPGLFAGYQQKVAGVYLGAELEAEVNAAEWFRERTTSGGGRNFAVEAKESYGAAARLGYLTRGGTLAYLKFGVVTTKVVTSYAKGGNRTNDIYRDHHLDGLRFGAGVEMPLAGKAFIRLEYSHTEYDDVELVTAHTSSDQLTFESRQDLFRLGLGFRF